MPAGLLQSGMSTQLPEEQQRRMGSSSHCGQKMSAGEGVRRKRTLLAPLYQIRASELCVDWTQAVPLAECTGGEGRPGALILRPTSQIHNEAVQVTQKPQAALVVREGKIGDSSPLLSGGRPQFVAHCFRNWAARPWLPPSPLQTAGTQPAG